MGAIERPDQPQEASEALRQCQERFARLVEIASEGYWEQDENYRFTLITGGSLAKSGIDPNTYIGTARWDHGAVPLEDDGCWDRHKAVLEARQPFGDFLFKRSSLLGGTRYISASGQPLFDVGGRFRGYCGTARDVTERRRADQLLKLEHSVTRSLAEADSVAAAMRAVIRAICETQDWECGRYFRVDERSGFLRYAEAWSVPVDAIERFVAGSRDLKYAPGEGLAGRAWQTGRPVWAADIARDGRVAQVKLANDTGMHGALVFPVVSEDRVIGVLTFNSREIRDPDQRLLDTIHVVGSQIGQFLRRKQAEEEQLRFRTAMDASADMISLVDRETLRYVDVNLSACETHGYSREEMLQKGPADFSTLDAEQLGRAYDETIASGGTTRFDGYQRRRDGSLFPTEVLRRAVRSGERWVIVAIVRDVTERRRAEELQAIEHAVTRVLAEGDSVAGALVEVMRVVCETLGWDCGRYFRMDDAAGVFRFAGSWHVPNPALERFVRYSADRTFAPGVGIVGKAGAGEPQWVADVSRDSRVVHHMMASDHNMRGAFMFPVISDGKVVGVLSFTSREIRQPDKRLLQAARVIGMQIGQFVRRKNSEEAVRQSEERFRGLSALSSDMFWEQDEQYCFTAFSGVGSGKLPQARVESILDRKRWEQDYANMTAEDWAAHRAVLDARRPFRDLELCRVGPSGDKFWVSVSGEPVFDGSGAFKGYRGVGKDITERKLGEERIQYLANHDVLTGLPNRAMFTDVLHLAIENARRYHRSFAVLFIDLDRFKVINDTLGHEAGDRLLQEMGARLSETVRSSDVVARLGGDEFVVLVQEVSEGKQVEAVARKILSAAIKPVSIGGQECRVTASIGICMYPADAGDEQALMKNADIAMYRAKEEGKNTYMFYSEETNVHSFERLALESSLRRGLERGEFLLHYQAKLDLNTRRINGVEALVRWQHPDLGMVPPGQFIPLAEETGLIVPLGKWVLNTACAQNMAWRKSGLPPMLMAVNLSARQFADEHLLQDITDALRDSAMPPGLLELELTESMVMQNAERAGKVLAAIKQLGVRLAIDDFGVGYSSLTHLKHFPIDTLKVDRSFIRDIPQDHEDKAITEAIIAMGKSLNLTVVAEGVETLEQETFLREHACDETQGYYFSKPITGEQFAALLRRRVESPERTGT